MRKFQKRIFIARPEGKDGIKKPKVKLLDADSKRIGERNWRRQARDLMNRGRPGSALGSWAGGGGGGGESEQGSMF